MRTIAHISDLHFGTEEPHLAEGLAADLADLAPDLVANSGDLTQRARLKQFAAARDYLDRLPHPQLTVPGNHDIPMFDPILRFLCPLGRYCRFISSELQPFFLDDELAVAGANTARPTMWKDGRIATSQIAHIAKQFAAVPPGRVKILVAHHPFVPTSKKLTAALVDCGREALDILEGAGCRLVLSGHLHHAHRWDATTHDARRHRSVLAVQAGTAISHRRRGEPNAYNVLRIDGEELQLEVRAWNGQRFAPTTTTHFHLRENCWAMTNHCAT